VKFLDEIRKKPEREKKMIIWAVLIIIGVIFIGLWIYICSKNLSGLKDSNILEEINIPLKETLPDVEVPPETEEDLEEIEKMLKENNE
jgi:hypothetical protein